jgi:hypothetical protein
MTARKAKFTLGGLTGGNRAGLGDRELHVVDHESHTADVIVWVRVKDIDLGQCDKGVRVRPLERCYFALAVPWNDAIPYDSCDGHLPPKE